MLRATALATFAAVMLAAPIASAQQIDLGRGGPRVDLRSPEQRAEDRMDRRMERDRAERRMMSRERERDRDRYDRGDGCRTVSVTDTDSSGRRVTRTRRSCD